MVGSASPFKLLNLCFVFLDMPLENNASSLHKYTMFLFVCQSSRLTRVCWHHPSSAKCRVWVLTRSIRMPMVVGYCNIFAAILCFFGCPCPWCPTKYCCEKGREERSAYFSVFQGLILLGNYGVSVCLLVDADPLLIYTLSTYIQVVTLRARY